MGMAKNATALAAVLLACGIGAASAQGQIQGQMQGQAQVQMPGQGSVPGAGQARTAIPPYSQQVPEVVPLQSHIDKPTVNPSAAGTLMRWDDTARDRNGDEPRREHSGSVGTNANTHPLKALEAGGEPRQEGMPQPAGIYPTPRSTMNRQDGR
jgi:hypothetical protein